MHSAKRIVIAMVASMGVLGFPGGVETVSAKTEQVNPRAQKPNSLGDNPIRFNPIARAMFEKYGTNAWYEAWDKATPEQRKEFEDWATSGDEPAAKEK